MEPAVIFKGNTWGGRKLRKQRYGWEKKSTGERGSAETFRSNLKQRGTTHWSIKSWKKKLGDQKVEEL